ncbi:MAG: DinB family protein [Chloroflexota bacterium]
MTRQENWLEKRFTFDFPVSRYPGFIQYLKQTPDTLTALVSGLPAETLIRRDGEAWSIQENAGHFLSVEELFLGRLDDYAHHAEILRPADFADNRTDKAHYNTQDLAQILAAFRQQRGVYIARLEALAPADFAQVALHPRLDSLMRLCDMLHFHAEHDRHHLERIVELKELWGVS